MANTRRSRRPQVRVDLETSGIGLSESIILKHPSEEDLKSFQQDLLKAMSSSPITGFTTMSVDFGVVGRSFSVERTLNIREELRRIENNNNQNTNPMQNSNTKQTRLDWFHRLPLEVCERAIKAVEKSCDEDEDQIKEKFSEECRTLDNAINQGFCWSATTEGQDYWSRVNNTPISKLLSIGHKHKSLLQKSNPFKLKKRKTFQRKTDWKFGMEPTFMISPKFIPKSFFFEMDDNDSEPLFSAFIGKLSDWFGDDISGKMKHVWGGKGEYDNEGSIEYPTPTYTDFQLFKTDYQALVDELDYYGFVPSSLTSLNIEGGCHQNFDLVWVKETYGNVVLQKFMRNIIHYINQNPWMVWLFLSPDDNESSCLRNEFDLENFSKGDFINPRGCRRVDSSEEKEIKDDEDFTVKYLELRFFMQPRTTDEMVLHYDFALQLLNYILKISIERKEYPQQVIKKELSRITFNQCVGGMSKVCETIGFDYNRLVETDKFKLLKRRFKNGLDYLV